MRKWSSFLVALAVAGTAHAQQAPIGAIGGGGSGPGSSSGGVASVPLDFPAERHGLPVPVGLVFTGAHQVGDAGVGWSVPLAFVRQATGFSRHRPRFTTTHGAPVLSATQPPTTVTLGGRTIHFVPATPGSQQYVALRDGKTLDLRRTGAGWDLFDGTGLRYRFAPVAGLGNPALFVLQEIASGHHGQSRVVLDYEVTRPTVPGLDAPELSLTAVRYNFNATGKCWKHEVALRWQPSGGSLLSATVDEGALRVRTRLLDAIEVRSRPDCETKSVVVSRHQLRYAPDVDTRLPRLVAVDRTGRAGTPAETTPIPVERYVYGRATTQAIPDRPPALIYTATAASVGLPGGADTIGRVEFQLNRPRTTTTLSDMNGDGLVDIIVGDRWARSVGGRQFAGPVPMGGAGDFPEVIHEQHTTGRVRYYDRKAQVTHYEDAWIQAVDMNGDGRTDVAESLPGKWRLHLNEPTGWRQVDVDMVPIAQALAGNHHKISDDRRVPISRSSTGARVSRTTCFQGDGTPESWVPCTDEPVHMWFAEGGQRSRVEWKLADVNGDGFPDLVANSRPSEQRLQLPEETGDCSCRFLREQRFSCQTFDPLQAHAIRRCVETWDFDHLGEWITDPNIGTGGHFLKATDNQMMVFYNRAGTQLVADSPTPFAAWVALTPPEENTCAVEEWREWAEGFVTPDEAIATGDPEPLWGYVGGNASVQVCGLADLSGDGLPDLVTPTRVGLGTGVGFVGDLRTSFPGALAETRHNHYNTCLATPGTPPTTTYLQQTFSGVTDVNGDGIADLWRGNAVRFGTGTGWGPETPVDGASFPLAEVRQTCGNLQASVTRALVDLDGDGRVEKVTVDEANRRLDVKVLFSFHDLSPGALNVGRITAIENGGGASTQLTYASLKSDGHLVPFPEIVPVSRRVTRKAGAGESMEPTRMAYRGARLWFDHVADAWTFRGYDRTVVQTGLPRDERTVRGTAIIADAWQSQDLATIHEQNLVAGRPRRVSQLAGDFADDPRALLSVDPAADARWRGDAAHDFAAVHEGGGQALDECTRLPQPYGPDDFLIASDGDFDAPCRGVGYVHATRVTRRQGRGQPVGESFVSSATEVVAVDFLGRPTTIHHHRDTVKLEDDVCEVREYANPQVWGVRDAVSRVQLLAPAGGEFSSSCKDAKQVLAGASFRYDNQPPGAVYAGLRTQDVVERRDGNGALLDEWLAQERAFDGLGNLVVARSETGNGLGRAITQSDWDAFGLVAGRTVVSASDVALPRVIQTEVDPVTLRIVAETDDSGVVDRRQHDGFGRPVLWTFIDPRDGREYVRGAAAYLGVTVPAASPPADAQTPLADGFDAEGPRVQVRRWDATTALADADLGATEPSSAEAWAITRFDYLGRAHRREIPLGADYDATRVVIDEVSFDGLGRVRWAADPYLAASGPGFGTSFDRDPDGSVHCTTRGRGYQGTAPTSLAAARFTSCRDVVFAGHRGHAQVKGVVDTELTSPSLGAYDELRFDGAGVVDRQARWHAGSMLERMETVHDRLGRPTMVTRWADPDAPGASTAWWKTHDSLGRPLAYFELGSAIRVFEHDRGGQQTKVSWLDGAVHRAVTAEHDGFGRLLRSVETEDDAEIDGTEVLHFYDEGSGEPFHDAGFARGRLTHAHSAAQSVFFGYDPFGRASQEAWVDADGVRVERRAAYRTDGKLDELRLYLPDTGYQPEVAAYAYDSAQRLRTVTFTDEVHPGGLVIHDVERMDAFGRPRAVRHGNGVDEEWIYRDADRDELVQRRIAAANGKLRMSYQHDAALRLSAREETSTVGGGHGERAVYQYDAASRLERATQYDLLASGTMLDESYRYDGLGNLRSLIDFVGTRAFSATFDPSDPDRICRVSGAGFPDSKDGCTFTYDALGAVTSSPLDAVARREVRHDQRGRPTAAQTTVGGQPIGASVRWTSDPFGAVASVEIEGSANGDRRDVRYGDAAQRTRRWAGKEAVDLFERFVPGGEGVVFSKRGAGDRAIYLYAHGDARGTRAVTDGEGQVVQELGYRPFGDVLRDTSSPALGSYVDFQWNGGDHLADLGVTRLGPRLYEARLGRFLERDPLINGISAGRAHPYGFAWNDPVNLADPSGLFPIEGLPTRAQNQGVESWAGALAAGAYYALAELDLDLGSELVDNGTITFTPTLLPTSGTFATYFRNERGVATHAWDVYVEDTHVGWLLFDKDAQDAAWFVDANFRKSETRYLKSGSDGVQSASVGLLADDIACAILSGDCVGPLSGGGGGDGVLLPGRGVSGGPIAGPSKSDSRLGRLGEKQGTLAIESVKHTALELRAAEALAAQGRQVVMRDPVGTRAGGKTSDLLVDGIPYDVYSPTTTNPSRIIGAIAKKNSQAQGVVLDLSQTTVTREQLGNILPRVQGAGGTNIRDIIVLP